MTGQKNIGIAVLPFVNMSADTENEYFSDGISEEIINALVTVRGLDVTARTSSFSFKARDVDVREIGEKLNVNYILEGSVRKSGEKVRISAQLVKVADGFHVFSEVYDRELKDIFEIQDEISMLVVEKLKQSIGLTSSFVMPTTRNKNVKAHEICMKSNYLFAQATASSINEALELYQKVRQSYPDYAPAYSGLSKCYTFLNMRRLMDPVEAQGKALEYAQKALELDDNLADAHLAIIFCAFWIDWDIGKAYTSLTKLLQSHPSNAEARSVNSILLLLNDLNEEALAESNLSLKLDPFSPRILQRAGIINYCLERYDVAIELLEKELKSHPMSLVSSILKGYCYILKNRPDIAIKQLTDIPFGPNLSFIDYGGIGLAYSKMGKTDKVYEYYQNLNRINETGESYFADYLYAVIYLAMNNKEKSFDYLELCVEKKTSSALFFSKDPIWKEFRQEKRFKEICKKVFKKSSPLTDNIIIKAHTQEELSINPDNLIYIEAQDNYSNFVWISNNEISEKLMRITLKHVEEQIKNPHIIRCQRSFIINTKAGFTVLGNSNDYKLKSTHISKLIPVSRSKGKHIVAKIVE